MGTFLYLRVLSVYGITIIKKGVVSLAIFHINDG